MVRIWTPFLLLVALDVIQFSNCKLCEGRDNTTHLVDVNDTATAEFCVRADETIDDVININKRPINLSETTTSGRYIVRVNDTRANIRCYTIHVTNMKVGDVERYAVGVTARNVSVCVYHFTVSFKNSSLRLCPGEDMNKTVTVYTNMTAMFHLCVTSDHGRVDHIGINKTVYVINGDTNDGPYKVREVTVTPDERSMQLLQIVVPWVSNEACVSYQLMFSPASELRITPNVLLKPVAAAFPKPCDNRQDYIYFLAKIDQPKLLKFCFRHHSAIRSISLIKHHSGPLAFKEYRIGNSSINQQHQINVSVTGVNNSDFGRYELRLRFDEDFDWNVTFYLLEETDVPSELCQNGATAATTISDLNSTTSFCVQDYGVVFENDSVVINGAHHVVKYGRINSSSKVSVSGHWDRAHNISYLQIHIHHLQNDDVKKPYNVTIPLLDKVFTFEIKLRDPTVEPRSSQHNQLNFTTIPGQDAQIIITTVATVETEQSSIGTSQAYSAEKSNGHDEIGVIAALCGVGFFIIITIITAGVALRMRKRTKDPPPSPYPESAQTHTSSERISDTPSSSRHVYERISDIISSILRSSSSGSSRSWSSVVTDYRRKVVLSEVVYAEYSLPDGSSWDSFSQRVESDGSDGTVKDGWHRDGSLKDGWHRDGTLTNGTFNRNATLSDGTLRDGRLSDGTLRDGRLSDGTLRDGRLSDGTLRDSTLRDCMLMNYLDVN